MRKSLLILGLAAALSASAAPISPLFTNAVSTANDKVQELYGGIELADEATAVPGTVYARPWGTFYAGYTLDGYRLTVPQLQIPPFVNLRFINKSTDATSLMWQWVLPENWNNSSAQKGTLLDSDTLTVAYTHTSNTAMVPPILTASNELGDSVWQIASYMRVVNEPFSGNNGSYYLSNSSTSWGPGRSFASAYYSNYNSTAYWEKKFPDYTNVRAAGFCELNQTPAAPYLLKRIIVWAYQPADETWNDDATLRIQQANINESTGGIKSLVKTLATLTCKKEDVIYLSSTSRLLVFDLTEPDEQGMSIDGLEISTAILSTFSVPEDGTTKYAMLFHSNPNNDVLNTNSLVNVKYTDGDGNERSIVQTSALKFTSGYQRSFCFMYDASFEWLRDAATLETAGELEAPEDGTTATLNLLASKASDNWWIGANEEDDLPEWLTVEASDVFENDEYAGSSTVNVTVAPLPAGVSSRESDVLFTFAGAKYVLHVTQKGSGVYGDVNGDGQVTAADVSAVYNIILGASTENQDRADVNGDGQVTAADVSVLYNIILGAN